MTAAAAQRDAQMMREALRLARKGRGKTSPNPMVGALVVKGRTVVGRGYHRGAGMAHAEVVALADAGRRAKGATLYVNLEPCCHHGRTPPCVEPIVAAGIKRVVVGMRDPNPLVDGKGLRYLRRRGIAVTLGVLEQQCRELNQPFVTWAQHGRPHVVFKSATTLDGRTATRKGHARWVTGEKARREGHRLRHHVDAIIVGIGTVIADNPTLTCRDIRGGRDPIRIIVDSAARTPSKANVVRAIETSRAPTWVVTTRAASATKVAQLQKAGAEVLQLKANREGRVPVPAMLKLLGRRGVLSVLLEGGPTLAGAFWSSSAVDRVVSFVAPKILGDAEALPMLLGPPKQRMDQAVALENLRVRKLGGDVMLSGDIAWAGR